MKDEENVLPRYLYERRAVITSFNFGLPKNLEIPEGIIGIAEDAFKDCPIIESVRIPGSVDFIRDGAFNNCRNLRHVEIIGEGVLEIASDAFDGCKNLTSVKIGRAVERMPSFASSGYPALEVEIIGEGVLEIGRDAFRYCENLTSVKIGGSVESIGRGAFSECSALESVTFDDPEDWYAGGSPINVNDPKRNAASLRNSSSYSSSYFLNDNWGYLGIYKSK